VPSGPSADFSHVRECALVREKARRPRVEEPDFTSEMPGQYARVVSFPFGRATRGFDKIV